MAYVRYLASGLLAMALSWGVVRGHGRLLDPPSRSTLWRFKHSNDLIKNSPHFGDIVNNYNDNELFCGGSQTQLGNGGKCGVCGDNYNDFQPRANEAGGTYGLGIITKQYATGSLIVVTVEITAQHQGYFEFRLCKWNKPDQIVTEECLNQTPLETDKGLRYDGITRPGKYYVKVKLPSGLTCSQCVLQWKYKTGNSWGCEENGKCGIGLGHQEHFYGCADVAIGDDFGQTSVTQPNLITSTKDSGAGSDSTSSMSANSTTSTATTQTRDQPSARDCEGKRDGVYYKWDCRRFFTCILQSPIVMTCPSGTAYDGEVCNYPHLVPGCQNA